MNLIHENDLSNLVLGMCIDVHKTLGPGLFESVYEEVISFELSQRQLSYERQKGIPVIYGDIKMDIGFRADLIIENKLILEIKSIEKVADVHKKQLLTYLRLSNIKLGLLINFNEVILKNGVTRIVNNL